MILFPRKSGQFKKLDSSAEDVKAAREGQNLSKSIRSLLPIANVSRAQAVTEISKADMPEGEKAAYRKLRDARSEARYAGAREKRAKAKADEAAAAKK